MGVGWWFGGHPRKAGAEPWSQKGVIRAEEAGKGRVKVMASPKRGRAKPSEMPPTLSTCLAGKQDPRWGHLAQFLLGLEPIDTKPTQHHCPPVASYPGTWQWAAVNTQFLSTSVPPQRNFSPLKRAACQGRSQEVPSITHRTFLEAVGTKGWDMGGVWDPLV